MRALDEILHAMTLVEKAAVLTGETAWTTTAIPRLGLPSLRMADGPHGVRRTHETGSMAFDAHAATCFPTACCSAATWDPELVREMGRAIASEATALGVDVVLGPGVNIKRSPLCGRNFEYFSEDPHLSGRLGAAWIDGVQSLGVGASLKHFAVNNQETRRMTMSAEVDERTLRELYLPAFEHAVKVARPWTVMCSYNRVNGAYASEHRELLTDILRGEWGFDGFVVSDWAAVHDRPKALTAGLDLEMPGPRPRRVRSVVDAVRAGTLDEETVDAALTRVLRVIAASAMRPTVDPPDADAHHLLARRIAADGMVLLKNDGLLPLPRHGRIAVIGRAAKMPPIQGAGSSQVTPTRVDSPIEELARLAPGVDIAFANGLPEGDGVLPDLFAKAVAVAAASDVAIVFADLSSAQESEGSDRLDIDLAPEMVALIRAVSTAQPRTAVVLFSGSAVAFSPWVDGVAAVLEAWYAGQAAGGAIADILFGVVDPGGRLPETFPRRLEDTPAYLDFPGDADTVRYGEGLFVGYRWYETRGLDVQYPFGHGLSYTSFGYANARVSRDSFDASQGTTVEVDVTNTGGRPGSDVVQVYVRDPDASVRRPRKELRGFARVRLDPGETRTVRIALDARAFSYWDATLHGWVAEPGAFELLIGRSSADIVASVLVTLLPAATARSTLTDMSPLVDWLRDEQGRGAALEVLSTIAPILGSAMGDGTQSLEDPGPHFRNYFGSMPLRGLLEFAAPAGGPDPDTELERLLSVISG